MASMNGGKRVLIFNRSVASNCVSATITLALLILVLSGIEDAFFTLVAGLAVSAAFGALEAK